MPSHNTFHHDSSHGFSLIEVVVVIALSGTVLGLGLLLSMDVYRGTTFRSTRTTLVSALTTARGRAMSNQYQSAHGVCYSAPDFIIFRGATYSAGGSNDRIAGNPAVTLTSASSFFTCGTGTGIVFSQISGVSSNTGTITIHESGHTDETVSVNTEGTIVW